MNYVIYFCVKNSCDVEFGIPHMQYSSAKEGIDDFLSKYAEKRGKKLKYVGKEEFEKIKLLKRPEDCFYIRKKNSEAVVYNVNISIGTIYNSYSIEKYGKIGIAEFPCQNNVVLSAKSPECNEEIKIKDMHVTNYERGAHVSFVTELKSVLSKRTPSQNVEIEKKEVSPCSNDFISSLIEGKKKLKTVE